MQAAEAEAIEKIVHAALAEGITESAGEYDDFRKIVSYLNF